MQPDASFCGRAASFLRSGRVHSAGNGRELVAGNVAVIPGGTVDLFDTLSFKKSGGHRVGFRDILQ